MSRELKLFDVDIQTFADGDVGATPPDGGVTPPATTPTEPSTPPAGTWNNGAQVPPATPPVEKTFSQKEVDEIINKRMARERANNDAQMKQILQQFMPQQNGQQSQQPTVDPMAQMVWEMKIERMEEKLLSNHPELKENKELMEQIYETATKYKLDDLEVAYNIVAAPIKQSSFEAQLKAAKDEAVKEYLKNKGNQPPTPEGSGGSVPSGAKVPKTFNDADAATKEFFRNLPK